MYICVFWKLKGLKCIKMFQKQHYDVFLSPENGVEAATVRRTRMAL